MGEILTAEAESTAKEMHCLCATPSLGVFAVKSHTNQWNEVIRKPYLYSKTISMPRAKAPSTFRFTGTLSSLAEGLIHTVIFLPEKIVKQFPEGRIRTKGTISGLPFALAPQYKKDGRRFFMVNASMRKTANLRVGRKVEVVFKLVHPDEVDIPEELEAVLAQDEKAMEAWKKLTSGYQRNIIIYVTSVKNVDSRIKRALESMEKMKVKVRLKPHS